jgi:hypothetical protein
MKIAGTFGIVLWLIGFDESPQPTAQTTATLVGQVVDATGGRLAGVAHHDDERGNRRGSVGGDGRGGPLCDRQSAHRANTSSVPSWRIFRPLVRTGVRLTVGQQVSLALTLEIGGTEEVRVVGGAGAVNTRSSELS